MEIKIDEKKIAELITEEIARKAVDHLTRAPYSMDSDKRDAWEEKAMQKILDQIDWANAGKALSEVAIKKFFEDNLTGKHRF